MLQFYLFLSRFFICSQTYSILGSVVWNDQTSIILTRPYFQDILKNTKQFKEAFTTFSGGYYEICIENHSTTSQAKIDFDMKHGVAAKDYSSVAKSKDLKPMELDVKYFLYL